MQNTIERLYTYIYLNINKLYTYNFNLQNKYIGNLFLPLKLMVL
jgi:hypothetical protein